LREKLLNISKKKKKKEKKIWTNKSKLLAIGFPSRPSVSNRGCNHHAGAII
jgi:hypothetical protein